MQKAVKPSPLFIISLLGALSVISPFAIDMYLPAFDEVAKDFGVENVIISLTISSYFIGMALGQIFYGPLLDRYGRKKPLYYGLGLFIVSSLVCAFAPSIEALIAIRFVQALGGCVAGVASLAMVHDLFPADEGAKILSRLFLFIAVSPLLAPSVGGMVALTFGWKAVFVLLAVIVLIIVLLMAFTLPETHAPDASISLKPLPILREYFTILNHPVFITYALAGAFSFAGLFTYVAGSPIVFMEGFHVSAKVYSMIFAGLAVGFIGGSQVNVALLKRFSSEFLFSRILVFQSVIGIVFMVGAYEGWFGLPGTLVMFFLFLSCAGLTYPNAAAMALAPFSRNTGSAAALLGFLQLGVGALISTFISISPSRSSVPIITIMGVTALLGLIILSLGWKKARSCSAIE